MEIILTSIIIILMSMLFILIFNSITGPFLNKKLPLRLNHRVSILIPARNEAENIAQCVDHLIEQDYPNKEIIVLDDNSDDNTARIVQKKAEVNPVLKLISGASLPPGWTGKNWACHQLAKAASGDILIFTDADTVHNFSAVSRTVGWMQKLNLGMLSAFPQQITKSLAESLIVPLIDLLVYGLLPLWSTFYIRSSSLSAANGQWIAFTRAAYTKIGGHESVKKDMVEDVELGRLAKQKSIPMLTTAGTGIVFCRMYRSVNQVWKGFTKIFFGLSGNSPAIFLLIVSLLCYCCVFPYILWFFFPNLISIISIILMNILIRSLLSIRYKHPFFISVILHPVEILLASVIGINALYQYYWGHYQWKDRTIIIRNNKK